LSIVQLLVGKYEESVRAVDIMGCAALHLACVSICKESEAAVRFSADEFPEALGMRNAFGKTPLAVAGCSYAAPNIIRLLLDLRHDIIASPIGTQIAALLSQRLCWYACVYLGGR